MKSILEWRTSAQTLKPALADRLRFLPTEEQGEFLLEFYRDTELCQRLKMGAASGDRQRLNRRVQSVLWSSKADAIKVAGFPRTITDRKGTFAKPAGW